MAAETEFERLAEIARLSGMFSSRVATLEEGVLVRKSPGLINRHKLGLPAYDNGPSGYHPPAYRGRGARGARGSNPGGARGGRGSSFNGARGRGRGRGAAVAARPHVNNVWTPSTATSQATTTATSTSTSAAAPQHQSVHRKLVINHGNAASTSSAVDLGSPDPMAQANESVASTSAMTTVKQTTPTMPEEAEEGEIEQTVEERKNAKINPGREITISGVVFIADATGKKLVRKQLATALASTASGPSQQPVGTPSKTSIGGQSYVRTKSGNLISKDLVKNRELEAKKKRLDQLVGIVKGVQCARGRQRVPSSTKKLQQQKTLCRYFQKTGVCTRGLTCPYVHDFAKVSICPRFLRNSCALPPSKCPLSHVPNANRMPHCLHFPYCNKGTDCPYSHVHVASTAKVCKDFVTLGWCEKGLECKERHVWECPEFSEKGTCKRKGCKLPHVIRRRGGQEGEDESTIEQKEEAQDGTGGKDIEHSLPDPAGDKGKKRQLDEDDEDDNDSSADEVEGELLNNHKKKPKLEFNPDAVEANADFVTLVISDTEESDGEEDDEDGEESSVDSDEGDEDESMEGDTTMQPAQEAIPKGISHILSGVGSSKDRFARRSGTAEGDEGEEGDSEDE